MTCAVCGGESEVCGTVDLARSCEDWKAGPVFPAAGARTPYRRCGSCGFMWAPEMYGWSPEEYQARVYNDEYARADPDVTMRRSLANAQWLAATLGACREEISHLDYGGGSGQLAQLLRVRGFNSHSWDPFHQLNGAPQRKFNLVTAFEVAEHVPSPRGFRAGVWSVMEDDSVLLFSTLTSDDVDRDDPLGWWYVAPRNGHVSLYSKRALAELFAPYPVRHLSAGLHLVVRGAPPHWLAQAITPTP